MINSLILAIRTVSSLGTVITAAAVPLFLATQGLEYWVPYSVIGLAIGRVVATWFFLPRITRLPTRSILVSTATLGCITTVLAATGLRHLSGLNHPLFYFTLSLVATGLATIDDSVAQTALGELQITPKLVHIDATLFTLCRVLAPGFALSLLSLFQNGLIGVLAIDAISYATAALLYFTILPSEGNTDSNVAHISELKLVQVLREHNMPWASLALLAFGAASFNAGIVVHLRSIGIPIQGISQFMIAQNVGMVLTGLALAHSPKISKLRVPGIALAATGLLMIALVTNLQWLLIASFVMATGMVTVMQGIRGDLAQSGLPASTRRMHLATFALVNSGAGICGALVWTSLSIYLTWSDLLILGAGFILLAARLPGLRRHIRLKPNLG